MAETDGAALRCGRAVSEIAAGLLRYLTLMCGRFARFSAVQKFADLFV